MSTGKKDSHQEADTRRTLRSGNTYGSGCDIQPTTSNTPNLALGNFLPVMDPRVTNFEKQFNRLEATVDDRFAAFEERLEKKFNTINDTLATLLRKINNQPKVVCPDSPIESLPSKAEPSRNTNPAPTRTTDKGKDKDREEPTELSHSTDVSSTTSANRHLYLSDGSINLHRVADYPTLVNPTPKEREVKNIWPEIKLRSEVFYEDFETGFNKNRAFLKPEWRLVRAKDDTFAKLRHIQSAFYTSLVPYDLWPQRLAPEMDGDFHLVRRLVEQFNISWVETVEAIIKILNNHQALHKPIPPFARLMLRQGENYEAYSWRVRDAFFRQPLSDRGTQIVRGILIENIRTYMPSVWAFLHDSHVNDSNSEIVDRVVQRAGHVTDAETNGSKIHSMMVYNLILRDFPLR